MMEPLWCRDWRDCVPRHIRVTGWGITEENVFQDVAPMQMVQAFGVTRAGQYIELFGYRQLGTFLGIRGEGIPKTVTEWPAIIRGCHVIKLGKVPRYGAKAPALMR